MRKWTPEQDAEILKAAEASPDAIREAFRELADKIGRTPDAIVTRYYNKLLKIRREVEDYENMGG